MVIIALLVWLVVAFISNLLYIALLADNGRSFDDVDPKVIAGCSFWPFPLLVYLVIGLIELVFWGYDTIKYRLWDR